MSAQTHTTHSHNHWYENFFYGPSVRFWDAAVPPTITENEVAYLMQKLGLPKGAAVLDIACGSGRHALRLAESGLKVTGIDISPDFLALARNRDREGLVQYAQVDFTQWESPPQYAGAYWMGNGFGYLPRQSTAELLKRLHAALLPGSKCILQTGSCAECILRHQEERTWYEVADLLMLVENEYNAQESQLKSQLRFLEKNADGQFTETKMTCLHHVYTVAEILALFKTAGFQLLSLEGGTEGQAFQSGEHMAIFVFQA